MMHFDLAIKNRIDDEVTFSKLRGNLINALIRKRYTLSEENAILRHKILNLPNADAEFAEFNEFVESCKRQVDEMIRL